MKTRNSPKKFRLFHHGKFIIGAGLALTAYGCQSDPSFSPLADSISTSCTVTKVEHTITIKCGENDPVTVTDGKDGKDGNDGRGAGIAATSIPALDERCPQGNGGVEYKTFIDVHSTGILACGDTITSVNYICNGRDGASGTDGNDGASSMITLTLAPPELCSLGGWLFTVTNGPVSSDPIPVCNGLTGPQGPAGSQGPPGEVPSGLMITRFIAPCGNTSSAWKEQLIQLSDGSLLASFSASASGTNTRFALIPDGNYIDTDESGCTFSVHTSGSTRSVSWAAGSSSAQPGGWASGSVSWALP